MSQFEYVYSYAKIRRLWYTYKLWVKEDIERLLDSGHKLINSHFAELLYETKIQEKIGMKIEK